MRASRRWSMENRAMQSDVGAMRGIGLRGKRKGRQPAKRRLWKSLSEALAKWGVSNRSLFEGSRG